MKKNRKSATVTAPEQDLQMLFREQMAMPNLDEINDSQYTWKRFTFICDKGIADKLHCIAEAEGFTLRQVMELFLKRGIDSYEKNHGPTKHTIKNINDIL